MGTAPAPCLCKLLFLRFEQNIPQGDRRSTLRSSNGLERRQFAGRRQDQASQTSNAGLTAPAARNTHHFPDGKAGDYTARVLAPRTDCTTPRETAWKCSILHLQTTYQLITQISQGKLSLAGLHMEQEESTGEHSNLLYQHCTMVIFSSWVWCSGAGFGTPTWEIRKEKPRG